MAAGTGSCEAVVLAAKASLAWQLVNREAANGLLLHDEEYDGSIIGVVLFCPAELVLYS